MAWSWSHTEEAYLWARSELHTLSRDTLIEIAAEWRMHEKHPDHDEAWTTQWPVSLSIMNRKFAGLTEGSIAEFIWAKAEAQATCDNGGYNAWMCPYGCHPHCVDFGPLDADEQPRGPYSEGVFV